MTKARPRLRIVLAALSAASIVLGERGAAAERAVPAAAAQAQPIKVTLLGTGCPTPVFDRFGPSILVEAAGTKLLFDAGRGAVQRLRQAGVAWRDVRGVFLTHLHSDHVVGFPDLWLTGWLVGDGRATPVDLWGPKGTIKMMAGLRRAFSYDLDIRVRDDGATPGGAVVAARDIQPGVVLQEGGVTVTAFAVDHRPVEPAFGYRIDSGGLSVVLSGDTRLSANLIEHARGVDLLVHEVVQPSSLVKAGVPDHRVRSVVAHHTTPEQAGEVFTRAAPRLAVYSHIVMPQADVKDLVEATRTTYAGPLEVGEDLMVIEVGDRVVVRRPPQEPARTGS